MVSNEKMHDGCVFAYGSDGCKRSEILDLYRESHPNRVHADTTGDYASLTSIEICNGICGHRTTEEEIRRYQKESETNAGNLLTTSEAARLLHVHPNTLRRWGDNGEIPVSTVGRRRDRRFARSEINNLLLRYNIHK